MPLAVIFDVDGTLADISHRRKYVASKPKNWKAFEAGLEDDKVCEEVALILDLFRNISTFKIVLASGRSEDLRQRTENWFAMKGLKYDALYMRKSGDYRSDDIVKEEILDQILKDGYEIFLVFDDRNRVVNMWRRRGYKCFQVADGDF